MKVKLLLSILLAVVIVESTILALPYLSHFQTLRPASQRSNSQSASFPFWIFNKPISNNTEQVLNPAFSGSWEADIQSSLVSSSHAGVTMAEIALAPESSSESHSIPTIIIQERIDGLLRIEYFAQNWPNTYGLLLYNSSTPGWTGERIVTLLFHSQGPPVEVDPQLAPRPNGDVDVLVGGTTIVSHYPMAWANLSDLYLYGYPGSSFTSGAIQISLSAM